MYASKVICSNLSDLAHDYRGKPYSHDVDLLLTHTDTAVTENLLQTLLAHLERQVRL